MHEKTHTRTDLQKCRYCPYETIQKSNMRLHEATHTRLPGKVRGRPAGRQNKGIANAMIGNNEQKNAKENINEGAPDEIEQFIAEMEKDQSM